MKPFLLPVAAIFAFNLQAVSTYAKPVGVPVHSSARCAVFWSAMTRAVPQDSAPYKQLTARKEAWLAHAAAAIGESEANRILNSDGPYYGNLVREMAGNAEALQAFSADYSECETAPTTDTPIAPADAPTSQSHPAITAKDKESGEQAFACAGMAQMNADIDNIIALTYYGKLSDYLPIVRHFRPDLSEGEIKSGTTAAQVEYAKLLERDTSARRSHTLAGKVWNPENSEAAALNQKCVQMANVMSRFLTK